MARVGPLAVLDQVDGHNGQALLREESRDVQGVLLAPPVAMLEHDHREGLPRLVRGQDQNKGNLDQREDLRRGIGPDLEGALLGLAKLGRLEGTAGHQADALQPRGALRSGGQVLRRIQIGLAVSVDVEVRLDRRNCVAVHQVADRQQFGLHRLRGEHRCHGQFVPLEGDRSVEQRRQIGLAGLERVALRMVRRNLAAPRGIGEVGGRPYRGPVNCQEPSGDHHGIARPGLQRLVRLNHE